MRTLDNTPLNHVPGNCHLHPGEQVMETKQYLTKVERLGKKTVSDECLHHENHYCA